MFTPQHSSPLARTTSPFKDPRPPPCTPGKTAKLWDEYEARAVENARKRDRKSHPQRSSTPTGRKGSEMATPPKVTAARSSFDFKFRRGHTVTPSATVSICKTCKQPVTYSSGICERCKQTIVLTSSTSETTPSLSPSARNFASTNLQQLHNSSLEEISMPISASPTRRSFCPLPTKLLDPPVRLDSLRPPPSLDATLEPARSRKVSLTDPNDTILRLQITQQHAYENRSHSHPATPTFAPATPPSTSHSQSSTRPSSLTNMSQLPTSTYPYTRNDSATPSELSSMFPYISSVAASPPSLCRSSYTVQNTMSAWDDWDSDDECEKMRLVGWMGRRKAKRKSGEKESKGSMDSFNSEPETTKDRRSKQSREDERLEQARLETAEIARASRIASESKSVGRRRPSGFVRVISCGCSQE